ncbi:MAG: hypothetical protein D6706_10605, partial [Chloroflexi bacterium]
GNRPNVSYTENPLDLSKYTHIYVDDDAPPGGTGLSPDSPVPSLFEASKVHRYHPSPGVPVFHLAPGIYYACQLREGIYIGSGMFNTIISSIPGPNGEIPVESENPTPDADPSDPYWHTCDVKRISPTMWYATDDTPYDIQAQDITFALGNSGYNNSGFLIGSWLVFHFPQTRPAPGKIIRFNRVRVTSNINKSGEFQARGIFKACYIENCPRQPIEVTNSIFGPSIFRGIEGGRIDFYTNWQLGPQPVTFTNNLLYNYYTGNIGINLYEGSPEIVVQNNIVISYYYAIRGPQLNAYYNYLWNNANDYIYPPTQEDCDTWPELCVGPRIFHMPITYTEPYFQPYPLLTDLGNPDPAWNDPDGTRNDIGPYGGPKARYPFPHVRDTIITGDPAPPAGQPITTQIRLTNYGASGYNTIFTTTLPTNAQLTSYTLTHTLPPTMPINTTNTNDTLSLTFSEFPISTSVTVTLHLSPTTTNTETLTIQSTASWQDGNTGETTIWQKATTYFINAMKHLLPMIYR